MAELDDRAIRTKVSALNRHRLTWVMGIIMIVHIAHIAAFWPYRAVALTPTERWRNEILLAHAALLIFLIVLLPVKLLLERNEQRNRLLLNLIPEFSALVYLIGGAALAIVDQQVTSSITPLVTIGVGIPLVFVLRPVVALTEYLLMLALFFVGVSWEQSNPSLLLTIRVNALAVTGLGFGLALLQWRNKINSLRQEHRIHEQQRELEAKNRELTILATRDSLTGLVNRAQFDREVETTIDAMVRTKGKACLVMADVDYFKMINDTYGHPVGDGILQEIAGILTGLLRSTDVLGRMGGEEFAILLPETTLQAGVEVAERLRAAVSEHLIAIGGKSIQITVSFGVAELMAGMKDGPAQSYRAADLALYQAKNDGRNCVRSLDPGAGLRHVAVSSQPADIA
ncbi:MAG TPA: GGDEF domain-containing protein [Symbiobacteriaceae bacterium]|nr:GGDEF domain-containing protein [Symbiobacteriaceae bacterium]